MSLFDGKPLTELDIRQKLMCVCGHMHAVHIGGAYCQAPHCSCDNFMDPAEPSAEYEQ